MSLVSDAEWEEVVRKSASGDRSAFEAIIGLIVEREMERARESERAEVKPED